MFDVYSKDERLSYVLQPLISRADTLRSLVRTCNRTIDSING